MRGRVGPTAHNGLVAGSTPAVPTNHISILLFLRCPQRDYRTRYVHFSFDHIREGVRQAHLLMSGCDSASTILAFPANGSGLHFGNDVSHLR
jgi:hypothetical protein